MPTKKAKDLDAPLTQRDLVSVTDTIREVADFIITEIRKDRGKQRKENKILNSKIDEVRKQGEISTKSLTQSLEEVKKQGETNTQSLALLTTQLNATKKLEFDIYNHEQRITKLEKVKS